MNLFRNLAVAMLMVVWIGFAAVTANAAVISGTYLGELANNGAQDNIEISLFNPANSYIAPNPSLGAPNSAGTTALNGVQDYHFYATSAASPDLSLSGGSLIADAITPSVAIRTNRRNQINFYTTKLPSLPYDASQRGIDLDGTGTFTGTVSLAGLDTSTPVYVYLITGTWSGSNNISITPYSGENAGTRLDNLITASLFSNERGAAYLSRVEISDFADIDRIDFEVAGAEAGLYGLVVTQAQEVPEPASLVTGLFGLALIAGRRRR